MLRPPRTLGLSLALVTSVILFTILPLFQVFFISAIQYRVGQIDVPVGEEDVSPVAYGTEFVNTDNLLLIAQVVIGLIFLVIAIMAWRGRPPQIRWVLMGAVILLTLLTTITTFLPLIAPQELQYGIDSGRSFEQTLLLSRLCFTIFIPLYVLWYLNRAPARAFFRGYYLPQPEQTKSDNN